MSSALIVTESTDLAGLRDDPGYACTVEHPTASAEPTNEARASIEHRGAPSTRQELGSLARQVAFARLWLPTAIVGIVVVFELVLLPRLDGPWMALAFYGLLGPTATVLTLSWIVREVGARERAQAQLSATYAELHASHELLGAIQRVTERFASATDLEDAVDAATRGVCEATGAVASGIVLGARPDVAGWYGVDLEGRADIVQRDAELRRGRSSLETDAEVAATGHYVLSAALRHGRAIEGSIHAVFDTPPAPRAREAFQILAGEFASVAEAARGRMRDLLTLFDVDRSVRAEGNLERLLGTVLDRTLERIGASVGAIFLADGGPLLHARVARPERDLEPLRIGSSRLAAAVEGDAPQRLLHLDGSTTEEASGLLDGARGALVLPLRTEDEPLGVVVIGLDDRDAVGDARLPFLTLLASQVARAVRNARAYLHVEELAIHEERSRIAREIHDGVAQSLASVALTIDLGRRLIDRDPIRAREQLERAAETVRESIREVRRSIFALRPVDLERHGFLETMRRYLLDFGPQNGVLATLDVHDDIALDVRGEAQLFRIFQEAMHNVAKHAAARTVHVEVGVDLDGRAYVQVRDDGKGFDVAAVDDRVTSAGGLGLRQMRERVEARAGTFEVSSHVGQGTIVRAAIHDAAPRGSEALDERASSGQPLR